MTPSFGWLQAFLCAADHLDYERAGADLGLNANRVKQRVLKLENWFHKLLIMDNPTELSTGDGADLIPIALAALNSFAISCPECKDLMMGFSKTHQGKLISEITLDDLARFLAVAEEGSYKGAAIAHDCNVTTIQRSVKLLEKVTKRSLFTGHSSLKITNDAEVFKESAAFIIRSLSKFRAVVLDDYSVAVGHIRHIQSQLTVRRAELNFYVNLIEKTGKKQRGKVRIENVKSKLDFINKAIEELEKNFGTHPNHIANFNDLKVLNFPKDSKSDE